MSNSEKKNTEVEKKESNSKRDKQSTRGLNKKKNTSLIVLIVAVVLVASGVIAVFAYKNYNTEIAAKEKNIPQNDINLVAWTESFTTAGKPIVKEVKAKKKADKKKAREAARKARKKAEEEARKAEERRRQLAGDITYVRQFIGSSFGSLTAVIGGPLSSSYAPSCTGEGKDGTHRFSNFTVYTYFKNGAEIIKDIR